MDAAHPARVAIHLRRFAACLLPLALGTGAALVLLLMAGGPARQAFAGTLTFPGCASTIQGCIDIASPGDTILIQAGNYTESLTLSKAVSLTGQLSTTTILHALPNTRVLTVTGAAVDSSVVISGLTFTGGDVTGTYSCPASCGGGIMITGTAQPLLTNLTIKNNAAQGYGGGLYADTGSPLVMLGLLVLNNTGTQGGGGAFVIADSTLNGGLFQGNAAGGGGGIYAGGFGLLSPYGSLTLTDTQFLSNTTFHYSGAGIFTDGAVRMRGGLFQGNFAQGGGAGVVAVDLAITGTQFLSNTGYGDGGAVFAQQYAHALVTFDHVLFQNNRCLAGGGCLGGALFAYSNLAITATRFLSNSSTLYGGAIYLGGVDSGQRQLVNNLFAGNHAGGLGAGVYAELPVAGASILHTTFADPQLGAGAALYVITGTVGITDTIFASHTVGVEQAGGTVYQDYNLFFGNGTNTNGSVSGGAHSFTGDPRFLDPGDGDYHLTTGSAAIDTGTNAGVTTDFEGDPRPRGAGFDIGYDELNLADVGLTKSASAVMRQPGQVLTYTLVFSNAGPDNAAAVRLTDVVPANVTAVSYTSSGAAIMPVGLSQYAWQIAHLAPGAGGVVTVTGVVLPGPRGTWFTNTATITTAYSDTNPSNNTSAVSVTVANAPPVAADDSYTMQANSTLTVTATGVLANDTDANNDTLTAMWVSGPVTGTLTLHTDGSFAYTPPQDFAGVVTFTYKANDGLADSNMATVSIKLVFRTYLPVVRR